jgi:hypothetical protein
MGKVRLRDDLACWDTEVFGTLVHSGESVTLNAETIAMADGYLADEYGNVVILTNGGEALILLDSIDLEFVEEGN